MDVWKGACVVVCVVFVVGWWWWGWGMNKGKLDQSLTADYGADRGMRLVFQNGRASTCDQYAAASCPWAQAVAQACWAIGSGINARYVRVSPPAGAEASGRFGACNVLRNVAESWLAEVALDGSGGGDCRAEGMLLLE